MCTFIKAIVLVYWYHNALYTHIKVRGIMYVCKRERNVLFRIFFGFESIQLLVKIFNNCLDICIGFE